MASQAASEVECAGTADGTACRLELAGASHVGYGRSDNQDAFLVDPDAGLAVVADGVGGEMGGEFASRTVVSAVQHAAGGGLSVTDGIHNAHALIRAEHSRATGRPASTVVVLQQLASIARIWWVGDSRAYRWHDEQFTQLTADHTYVQIMLARGMISEDEAARHPRSNALARAVGMAELDSLPIDHLEVSVTPGDQLLLCSDGLSGFVPQQQIAACLQQADSAANAVEKLIELALECKAADNVTIVCAWVSGPK